MKPRELIVSPCEVGEIRDFIERNHYSHSINGVKVSYCFKVEYRDQLCGAVLFGGLSTTAWKKFGEVESAVLELRRLVLVEEAEKNSESRVIGQCIRWITKNAPLVKTIVSYADPSYNHIGTIYKASNFLYIGRSGKDVGFKDPTTGKVYHSRALRTKYKGEFKPFVKRLRALKDQGRLIPITLDGKFCYVYTLKRREVAKR